MRSRRLSAINVLATRTTRSSPQTSRNGIIVSIRIIYTKCSGATDVAAWYCDTHFMIIPIKRLQFFINAAGLRFEYDTCLTSLAFRRWWGPMTFRSGSRVISLSVACALLAYGRRGDHTASKATSLPNRQAAYGLAARWLNDMVKNSLAATD
jgi:hypothetical protein